MPFVSVINPSNVAMAGNSVVVLKQVCCCLMSLFERHYRGIVLRELHKLYQKHACEEYLENWPQLVKYCGYREDNLPQVGNLDMIICIKDKVSNQWWAGLFRQTCNDTNVQTQRYSI